MLVGGSGFESECLVLLGPPSADSIESASSDEWTPVVDRGGEEPHSLAAYVEVNEWGSNVEGSNRTESTDSEELFETAQSSNSSGGRILASQHTNTHTRTVDVH